MLVLPVAVAAVVVASVAVDTGYSIVGSDKMDTDVDCELVTSPVRSENSVLVWGDSASVVVGRADVLSPLVAVIVDVVTSVAFLVISVIAVADVVVRNETNI